MDWEGNNVECFFNTKASDVLQHISILLEVSAFYLICKDYRTRERDLASKGRGTMVTGLSVPHPKRRKELFFAYIVAVIAILMELYQLLTQYCSC
jgi:hypothetical protein